MILDAEEAKRSSAILLSTAKGLLVELADRRAGSRILAPHS
jgi:hypothetical protein